MGAAPSRSENGTAPERLAAVTVRRPVTWFRVICGPGVSFSDLEAGPGPSASISAKHAHTVPNRSRQTGEHGLVAAAVVVLAAPAPGNADKHVGAQVAR